MKKKIIFLNNHFQTSDGTVRALTDLCNSLDPDKFDITIAPIYRCDTSLKSQLRPDIKLKRAFGFYFKGFSKIVRRIPPKWLYKWLINGNYDIEIAFQCGIPTKLVGMCKRPDKVQVCWMHGYDNYPQYYCNVDQVVCVSRHNADRCRKELPYKADVSYCYNLMDDQKICAMGREEAQIPQGQGPLLVTVGRISPEKGFVRLVKIMAELKNQGYAFRLMIIGDGPQMSELKNTVQQLHMEDRVFLPGQQSNPHKYTSKADLFICSSFSEGYSTACGEAAILGVPVLSTNVPGAEEIVEDCEAGMVVPMDDRSLMCGIQCVLDQPDKIEKWKTVLQSTRTKFFADYRAGAIQSLFDKIYQLSLEKRG